MRQSGSPFWFTCILITLSSAANADWTCKSADVTRRVSVEYETASAVPCRVTYEKQGTLTYPWRAERQLGYCEAKAEQLVERLRSFGWTCDRSSDVAPTADKKP